MAAIICAFIGWMIYMEIRNRKIKKQNEKAKSECMGLATQRENEIIYTRTDRDLNEKIAEIMDDYAKLVDKAKRYGLDIRLYNTSETLELYFNDDYPDTILVDKVLSCITKGEN